MAIHNRQDLHPFAPASGADAVAAALRHGQCRIDEALAFVHRAFLAQRVRQLRENAAQNFAFTPLLDPAMHGLVVGIALREQVPLCAGIENPQHRLQDGSSRHRLAAGTTVRDVVPRENVPESVPIGRRANAACARIKGTFFISTTILR